MKKPDLGQTLAILANVGVVAGILLLVFELSQNREMMRAQTRNELSRGLTDVLSLSANNPLLADVLVRANHGEELTPAEQMMFVNRSELVFRYWENVHYQYRQGLYDEVEFSKHLETMESVMMRNNGLIRHWCETRTLYSVPFAEEIDDLLSETTC